MTQLPKNDTTMTQLNPEVSWGPHDTMTQVFKLILRVRARRPGFKRSVIVPYFSTLIPSYDTMTQLLTMTPSRARAHAHTRPRDLNLSKVVSLCHKRHALPARSTS